MAKHKCEARLPYINGNVVSKGKYRGQRLGTVEAVEAGPAEDAVAVHQFGEACEIENQYKLDAVKTSLCWIRDVFWSSTQGALIRYQNTSRIQVLR